MNKLQKNVKLVLERMISMVEQEPFYAEIFSEELQVMLDLIQQDDGFGTEAQCDPRGDFRNGKWSMNKVQAEK